MAGRIISASRRTDVPAFYSEWFLARLREGYACARNPYTGKTARVSLKSADIHSIVFWSKNFNPLLKRIKEVERVTENLFFHFTVTASQGVLEKGTPERGQALEDMLWLSERYSPARVVWRFDPVAVTPELTLEDHMEAFTECADRLAGRVRACVISFAHPYGKVVRNFREEGREGLVELSVEERRGFARTLAAEAAGRGIPLMACCNEGILQPGVEKARCVDGETLAGLFGPGAETGPGPTRKGCGCSRSVDIGTYDTCPHGCVYCYANSDRKKAAANLRAHRNSWNGLGFHEEDIEAEEDPQGRLF